MIITIACCISLTFSNNYHTCMFQALRLSHSSLSLTTTGQIVNLMTSDIQPLEMVCDNWFMVL